MAGNTSRVTAQDIEDRRRREAQKAATIEPPQQFSWAPKIKKDAAPISFDSIFNEEKKKQKKTTKTKHAAPIAPIAFNDFSGK